MPTSGKNRNIYLFKESWKTSLKTGCAQSFVLQLKNSELPKILGAKTPGIPKSLDFRGFL